MTRRQPSVMRGITREGQRCCGATGPLRPVRLDGHEHYVGRRKYLYPSRLTVGRPDWPGNSFRTIDLPARAEGCPLFDRPKRGRKKPHQPALAHCVRVAGRSALRRAAQLCIGTANRKGPEGHPADSLLRRSDIDSHGAPLHREAAFCAAPRKARKGGEARTRPRTPVVFFFRSI